MIAREEFRLMPGFEDKVKISNLGYAVNLNYNNTGKERRFKLSKNAQGYVKFGFGYKGKKYSNIYVHKVVAKLFIPNPDNLPEVNHIDENKENNCVDNLEWCDRKYNCNYGTRTKRSAENRKSKIGCYDLNGNLVKVYDGAVDAEKDGFIRSVISRCCNGKLYKHHDHMFKFID
jgi:hypothetical protein